MLAYAWSVFLQFNFFILCVNSFSVSVLTLLYVCLLAPHQVRDRPSPEQSPLTPSNDEGTSSHSLQETSPPQPPPLPCLLRTL